MSSNNVLDVSKKEKKKSEKKSSEKKSILKCFDLSNEVIDKAGACATDTTDADACVTDTTDTTDAEKAVDAEKAEEADTEPDIEVLLNDIILSMNKCKQEDKLYETKRKQMFSDVQTKIKHLEKICKKDKKKYSKLAGKQNKGNKAPSGFAKPMSVSDELCSFMNRENGTKISRTEVTQYIIKYIKDQDLQKKSDTRYIIPNEALRKLWNTKEDEEVTYFTIQRLMNPHFT